MASLGVGSDLRSGLRQLRRNPGFALLAVLTLTLGIGANAAIFSLLEGILLRPLPYPQPEQMVQVFSVWPNQPHFPMAVADFFDYRQRLHIFSASALYAERDLDLTTAGRAEHLTGIGVSAEYFRVLGFHPALGRDFNQQDELRSGGNGGAVVILSDELWRARFHAAPSIVGQTLDLSGQPYTVVGIMPPGIQHVGGVYHSPAQGARVALWTPIGLRPYSATGCDRGCHYLNMIGRLRPGVTLAQARREMDLAAAQLRAAVPGDHDEHALVVSLKQEVAGSASLMLQVLMGAALLVLLIGCVRKSVV